MFSKLYYSIVIFPCLCTFSQAIRYPVSSSYTNMVAYSKSQTDVFSFTSNPASLTRQKKSSAGILSERKFLLNELNLYTAVGALVMKTGGFGVRLSYSGFKAFHESLAGITYARKLLDHLAVGVDFNYYAIGISGYGNSSAIHFGIGYLTQLTEEIHIGMHAYNPVGGKFRNNEDEKLASIYSMGFGYEPSSKFFMGAVIEKKEEIPIQVKAGFQYGVLNQLLVRAGIDSETSALYIGIGFTLKSLRIDVYANRHPVLGLTPGILLLFNFKSVER